ncbi:hypothetical protein [Streptomyces europaeiscabiei]|uniref:hypothetical protein n=1 Tax=Streptomyces europaeiscabiei TaxID=146819 RepID=UPI002E167AE4|nr:hypothetical protein OHB30_11165 [Streptomyces europaeiscabiei]
MLLERGISLVDATVVRSTKPRIWISSGLKAAPAQVMPSCHHLRALDYEGDAVVAKEPWILPSVTERDTIANGTSLAPGCCIAILSLPRELYDEFTEIRSVTETMSNWNEANRYVSSQAILRRAIEHALEHTEKFSSSIWQMGVRVNPPGLPNVTVDNRTDLLVGLHCDNWFDAPMNARSGSPNRIAMNLGLSDRFLTYINLPLAKIWQLANGTMDLSTARLTGDLLFRFMEGVSSYPVTRVRISPGEAYIAPTDNIIHDGNTQGAFEWDIYFTIVSRFRIPGHARHDQTMREV